MKTDILIVGSGCSGLYAVLNLPDELDIMLITKSDFESSDSFLAQGGMCTLKDPSDYDSFFEDTLKAGHYENDQKSVEIMIKSSPDVVKDLVKYGVSFTRDENGDFVYTREGAHAHHRILFHEYNTEEKFPYFGRNTKTVDMLITEYFSMKISLEKRSQATF